MVSTGKGDVGAAKLTGEVLDVVEKMPLLVQNMTGVDISKVSIIINPTDDVPSYRWDFMV